MSQGDESAESGGVQEFIRTRQAGVLERAITALRDCPPQSLAAESHRLAGTLGTYQLTSASTVVRELYDQARAEGSDPAVLDRTPALAAMAAALEELAPAEPSP